MAKAHSISTHLEHKGKFSKMGPPMMMSEEMFEMKKLPYSSSSNATRHRSQCRQRNHQKRYWNSVNRVLRNLEGTANYYLTFTGVSDVQAGYADSDQANDADDRVSYIILLS
ncbi:hypothetical protein KM043_016497 [Ampulex compressa]|nr:hypothetical protein KM043_016497 [Ampulex compressa]